MTLLPKGKYGWILIVFIGYVYISEYTGKKNLSPNNSNIVAKNQDTNLSTEKENPQSAETKKTDTLANKVIDNLKQNETAKTVLEALVRKSVEDKYGTGEIREIAAMETGSLAIIDVIRGNGAQLNCGAKAVLNYEAFMSNGLAFDSTKSKDGTTSPITVATGNNQVIKGLEAGIIGMREGGRRKISIPPGLAFNMTGFDNNILSKDDVISYDVELVSIKDGMYKNAPQIQISNITEGKGKKILCGDKVKIRYHLSTLDKTPIEGAGGDIEFIIGSGNVPIGLEFMVVNMKVGGKSIAEIPYTLLKIAEKSAFKDESLLKKDMPILAEIEILGLIGN